MYQHQRLSIALLFPLLADLTEIYDLVIAKGGSKLQPSGDEPGFGMTNTGSITFKKTTVPTFANVLSGDLGRK